MSASFLEAAFTHHVWATSRVVDACLGLSSTELETNVPGTRGPLHETLRHLVGSDAFDLLILTGDRTFDVETDIMPLPDVRLLIERIGSGWAEYVSGPVDPNTVAHEVDESDGFQRWAPVGLRLAGTLEHGADHRSQICTALTTIGVRPPRVAAFDFGMHVGQVVERMPGT